MDLMGLCRLCLLKNGGNIPIFTEDDPERIVKITTCLPVNISKDDCFPKSICDNCSFRLESSYQFWKITLNTEEELMMLNQMNVKPDINAEEAVVTVFQIKNESFEIKEEVTSAHEKGAVTINVEICTEKTSSVPKSEEMFSKQLENNDNLKDNFGAELNVPEVDSLNHTASQNPLSVSSCFQVELCNKRRAAIKAAKIIRNIAGDAEDVNNSEINEDFIKSIYEDVSEFSIENSDSNFASVEMMTNADTLRNACNFDNLKANYDTEMNASEVDFFQTRKLNKRRAAINVSTIIGNGTADDLDEDLIIPTNKDTSENEDSVENFDFVGKANNTEVISLCDETDAEIKRMRSDKVVKGKLKFTDQKLESSEESDLQSLIDQRTNKQQYKCDICEYKCAKAIRLKCHMYIHTGEMPYKCNVCEYKCIRLHNFSRHVRKHIDGKPTNCSICEYKCLYPGNLQSHMRKHTGEKLHKCNVCDRIFPQAKSLQNHIRKHTNTDDKLYKCSICKREFAKTKHLKEHMHVHTGEKPYKCNICEHKFSQASNLQSHMRSKHTGEKPFKCNICEYKCSRKELLRIHIRTHTGEKPYECNICENRFSQPGHLKIHKRTHTGEKPYKCSICEYKASRLYHLKTHMSVHTGEKRLKCHDCSYQSNKIHCLMQHVKKTHAQNCSNV